ncbi:MAG: rRNA maturation RNAse YbeY [Patescibacteria group bacterium]
MENKITVVSLEKIQKKIVQEIQGEAVRILKILKKKNLEVEIYLANNRMMRRLNKEFRGKDKTTTVLSFEEPQNFILPSSKFRKIGEIYLNISDVSRQLLVHGLLHLLGYDHKRKNDRIKMEKLEQYVYNRS